MKTQLLLLTFCLLFTSIDLLGTSYYVDPKLGNDKNADKTVPEFGSG